MAGACVSFGYLHIHGGICAAGTIAVAVASFIGLILSSVSTVAAGAAKNVVGASSGGTVAAGLAVVGARFWSGHYLSCGCLLIFSSILSFRAGSFAAGAAVAVTCFIVEIILQH